MRSVDQQTKLLCIIALSNLLDETTVNYMLDEVRTHVQHMIAIYSICMQYAIQFLICHRFMISPSAWVDCCSSFSTQLMKLSSLNPTHEAFLSQPNS